jgi:Resolvase, N terminal domain
VVEQNVSGSKPWRERALGEAVAACERGKAAGVIVAWQDRLSRENGRATAEVWDALKEADARLVCAAEGLDTAAADLEMLFTIFRVQLVRRGAQATPRMVDVVASERELEDALRARDKAEAELNGYVEATSVTDLGPLVFQRGIATRQKRLDEATANVQVASARTARLPRQQAAHPCPSGIRDCDPCDRPRDRACRTRGCARPQGRRAAGRRSRHDAVRCDRESAVLDAALMGVVLRPLEFAL